MRVLLDTHALLWALEENPRLGAKAREAIGAPENEILVSAASVFEITLKHRIGKLPEAARHIANWNDALSELAVVPLAISVAHAELAGSLDIAHKDPFDRLLIAQAQIERVPIVSNEKLFDGFGVSRLW